MNEVLQRIEDLRESKKISKYKLCKDLKISQSTYTKWIYENRVPPANRIQLIAEYFGVDANYIMTGKNEWQPQLTDKDEKSLDKKVEELLTAVDSDAGLMLDGEIMDEETREVFAMNLKNALRTTKLMAKAKYTPNKYRK